MCHESDAPLAFRSDDESEMFAEDRVMILVTKLDEGFQVCPTPTMAYTTQ